VIFTVYRDTADYLFNQLKARGFSKLAMISGSGSKTNERDIEVADFEPILERFAPFTKLFKEKEWQFVASSEDLSENEKYYEWISWISENDKKTYEQIKNPIDILIATDTLSEGQNLQDADMVINYDIHWNPVRIIQRMGRIDRLGSPNDKIFGINFWPSDNINSYLDLQGRIEQRMAAMQLAGAEVHLDFSDTFKEMAEDTALEQRLKSRMIKQMQTTWEDIEVNDQSFGFNHLSLEKYRQDLLEEYNQNSKKYSQMPNGVYTGFKSNNTVCSENGIIALLGYPARQPKTINHIYKQHNLIYIDKNGKPVLLNQKEVLDILNLHKDKDRYVDANVDKGEPNAIAGLSNAIKSWLKEQVTEQKTLDDGTVVNQMGKEPLNILANLKDGNKKSIDRLNENKMVSEKFTADNFDLLVWFLVTKE
ncbi:MAG: C-terminal helicase domain-containing protein, partial [Bacteroidales bacterium]|nr:C-terminal helicase domain-containing protein [Bacteroidales bacterium]